MDYKIIDIEGIGDVYAQKLIAAGINKVSELLEKCAAPKGRKELAEATGISEKLILKWTNHADLFRINGVGPQFAELLEAAGVDTVRSSVTAWQRTCSRSWRRPTLPRTSATAFLP